jgi:serine protease Do
MKTKSILMLIAAVLPLSALAQQPPPVAPPAPPPNAPMPPDRPNDRRPRVPVTYLGVETSEVPRVLCEQLGLPRGFGLVVDYVSPEGPAATGGVKEGDILKMLNDQILVDADQLGKLVRSYPEGTNVTLTVLRKGVEQKIPVRLGKRDVPARHGMGDFGEFKKQWKFGDHDFEMAENMEDLKDLGRDIGDAQKGIIRNAVEQARREVERAKDEMIRAREEARHAIGEVRVSKTDDNGTIKTTRIDLGKAQIVYSDGKGEMKIDSIDGKKQLTAKDPQGQLIFSGPVETKEDRDKMPPDLRDRFEKFKETELPGAIPPPPQPAAPDADDDDDDDDDTPGSPDVNQVSLERPFWTVGTVRI